MTSNGKLIETLATLPTNKLCTCRPIQPHSGGRFWPRAEVCRGAERKTALRSEAAGRRNRVIISAGDPQRSVELPRQEVRELRLKALLAIIVLVMAAWLFVVSDWYLRAQTRSLFASDAWPLESGMKAHFDREKDSFLRLDTYLRHKPEVDFLWTPNFDGRDGACYSIEGTQGCLAVQDDELATILQKSDVMVINFMGVDPIYYMHDRCYEKTIIHFGYVNLSGNQYDFPLCSNDSTPKGDNPQHCLVPIVDSWHLLYSNQEDAEYCS